MLRITLKEQIGPTLRALFIFQCDLTSSKFFDLSIVGVQYLFQVYNEAI